MAVETQLLKLYYWLIDKSYYELIVKSNGQKVATIIQVEPTKIKGGDSFIISKSLKMAWLKPVLNNPETGEILYTNGKSFVCLAKLNNIIPCIEEKEEIQDTICNDLIIRKSQIISLREVKQAMKNSGITVRIAPDELIDPSFLKKLLDAHFVEETIKVPNNVWEEKKWIFIAGFIVLAFIVWQVISSGALSHGI